MLAPHFKHLAVAAGLAAAASRLPAATLDGWAPGVAVDAPSKAFFVPSPGFVNLSATVTGGANMAVTWAPLESHRGSFVTTSVADSTSATAHVAARRNAGGIPRPPYNTGVGFFVLNGKLYDANGIEFRIKGANTAHWDEGWTSCASNCGFPNARFNLNRMFMPLYSGMPTAGITGPIDKMISQKIVPLVTINWLGVPGVDTRCTSDVTRLRTAVSQWVSRAPLLKPYERHLLVNIANEWGPGDGEGGTVWRDEYLRAVASLRAAGYRNAIVIDAGDCGKDPLEIIRYGQAIFDADPQHNVLFSLHIYDWFTHAGGPGRTYEITAIAAQLKATGLPIIFGEFGPRGLNNTPLTPGQIIEAANTQNLGWIAWAWDDGVGNGWFGMTMSKQFLLTGGKPANGAYPNNTDLTLFGNEVILNPTFGTFATAVAATVFP